MDKPVDELLRQQYLVPRRSVAKLRQLSRQHKVSVTEIVRRAIEAYDPSSGDRAAQEAAALELLAEVHGQLRKSMRRIDSDMAALQSRQRALDDGSVREEARHQTEGWLRRNPQALDEFAELFAAGSPRSAASAPTAGNGARTGGNGARVRALRR
jgi:hypothetical protein